MSTTRRLGARSPSRTPRRKGALVIGEERHIDRVFAIFDAGRRGGLNYAELKAALRSFGLEVRKPDVLRLLQSHGKDVDGSVDLETFREMVLEKLTERDPDERVQRCFDLLDVDGTGKLHLRSLKKICKEIGMTIDEAELEEMIETFDRDGDGCIDRADFEKIVTEDSDMSD